MVRYVAVLVRLNPLFEGNLDRYIPDRCTEGYDYV